MNAIPKKLRVKPEPCYKFNPHLWREYNSSGQMLAPREQWGEETGETAADYDRGFNDPGRAFDES